jgi:hypothetical protein
VAGIDCMKVYLTLQVMMSPPHYVPYQCPLMSESDAAGILDEFKAPPEEWSDWTPCLASTYRPYIDTVLTHMATFGAKCTCDTDVSWPWKLDKSGQKHGGSALGSHGSRSSLHARITASPSWTGHTSTCMTTLSMGVTL